MRQVSEPDQSPLTMECRYCGHREHAEIQPPPPWAGETEETEYRRVVVRREAGRPSADELRGLRFLSEDLASRPLGEVAKLVGEGTAVDLGVLPIEEAEDLAKRASGFGFDAEVQDPGQDSGVEEEKAGWGFDRRNPFGLPVTVGDPEDDSVIIPFYCLLFVAVGVLVVLTVVLISCWPK